MKNENMKETILSDITKFMAEPAEDWIAAALYDAYSEPLQEDATRLDAVLMWWSYAHSVENLDA